MAADNTAPKQRGAPFTPGHSGNAAGRPKGSRNKLGEAFLEAMHADFEAHGAAVIARVREEKPDQYLKVVASILPKELNVTVNEFDGMSDDELIEQLRRLDATIRPFLNGAEEAEASAEEEVSEMRH